MSTIPRVELDSTLRCPDAVDFERRLRERVVGQDEAIDKVTWMVQTFMAGFNPPGRPAGILLLLGPTGLSALRTYVKPGPLLPTLPLPPLPFTANAMPLSQGKWLEKRWLARNTHCPNASGTVLIRSLGANASPRCGIPDLRARNPAETFHHLVEICGDGDFQLECHLWQSCEEDGRGGGKEPRRASRTNLSTDGFGPDFSLWSDISCSGEVADNSRAPSARASI